MARICSPPVYRIAVLSLLLALCSLPLQRAVAESGLSASAAGNSASARLMFRIVIPQTLAFSVVDRGTQAPALSVGLRISESPRHQVPVSLGQLPLVRCQPASTGGTVCTAATP